ncbi:MAG: nitrate reductase molybdenum cofactor assembly chaperone [Chloroflexota bacterium]
MTTRALYDNLADLFAYPGSELPLRARRCLAAARDAAPAAVPVLAAFADTVASQPSTRLEEVYSATFDLSDACCPYLGYHVFGASPKRAALMVELKEAYGQMGIDVGSELPDHLCLVLRYLARCQDEELAAELEEFVLMPGLEKMAGALADGQNPYADLVHTAQLVVQGERTSLPVGGAGDV